MRGEKASLVRPALFFILLLATLLRAQFVVQPLTDWFTWREASTAMMADNLPRNGWNPLWPEVSWTGEQVGYQGREFQVLTVAAAAANEVFGWRDWHGRFIAILCGVLSVLALHQIALHLYGIAEARAAAFVFAVMPGAVVIDSSYLPDPAMLALVTTTFWALVVGLKERRRPLLVLAGFLGMLALLAKLPALAAVPAAAYLVWEASGTKGRIRGALMFGVALALISVPVFAYYRWAVSVGSTYPPYHIAGSGYLWEDGLSAFVSSKFFLPALKNHAKDWLWTWPIIVLTAVGLFVLPHSTNQHDGHGPEAGSEAFSAPLFFHVWLAGCAAFYVVAAREVTDNPWNLHIFSPAVAALGGRGLLWIGTGGGQQQFAAGSWLRVGAVSALMLYAGYAGAKIPKDNIATDDYLLGRHLARIAGHDDLLIVSGSEAGNPVAIYYSRRHGWIFPPPPQQVNYMYYMDDGAPSVAVLEELKRRGARWFGIVKLGRDFSEPRRLFVEHHPQLLSYLSRTATLVADEPAYLIYSLQ